MKKVLIIGSRNSGIKNDPSKIAQSLNSDNVVTSLLYWEDLVFDISSENVQVLVEGSDILADNPSLVVAVGWYKNGKDSLYRDVAFSLALVLKHAGVSFWNSEMANQRSISKLSTMVQLALEGVSVPRTLFSLDLSKIETELSYPFIAKAASASRGMLNFLVENNEVLSEVKQNDEYFLIQSFMPNDHDLRVICFGGKPHLVLRRARRSDADTHLNNTSQGGEASWIELSDVTPGILTLSEKICKIMGREMAGIDLIPDASSALGYSCLEVNAVPQLTSGTDSEKKLATFNEALRAL